MCGYCVVLHAVADGTRLRREQFQMSKSYRTRPARVRASARARLPRVVAAPTSKGNYHPASEAEVVEFLKLIGPKYYYGVREIRLEQRPRMQGMWRFGMLRVPGRIALFEQPYNEASSEEMKEYMLFHVLAHELAHHCIQHYKWKRAARVMRTSDHECVAEMIAARIREHRRRWRA
jgi:hypothetical protein